MRGFLHHLFIPQESNNHRAKLLHHQIIFSLIVVLVITSFVFRFGKNAAPEVLGVSINITADQLLQLTNQQRQQHGLRSLTLNPLLSQAASFKATDMFAKDYWAHTAPDGTTPWYFFRKTGYVFTYAGENLARGFTTSKDTVTAWMASPSHRDNILSPNYMDIGFAVKEGVLGGEDTILVVQMFGSTNNVATPKQVQTKVDQHAVMTIPSHTFTAQVLQSPAVDTSVLSLHIGLITIVFFIFIFSLDMIIVERKKIVRLVGHNIDHILFLSALAIGIVILTKGIIL